MGRRLRAAVIRDHDEYRSVLNVNSKRKGHGNTNTALVDGTRPMSFVRALLLRPRRQVLGMK